MTTFLTHVLFASACACLFDLFVNYFLTYTMNFTSLLLPESNMLLNQNFITLLYWEKNPCTLCYIDPISNRLYYFFLVHILDIVTVTLHSISLSKTILKCSALFSLCDARIYDLGGLWNWGIWLFLRHCYYCATLENWMV